MLNPPLRRHREFIVDWEHMKVLHSALLKGESLPYRFRNIPLGAKFIDVTYRPEHMGYGIVMEHESFEPVPEGQIPFEAMAWRK